MKYSRLAIALLAFAYPVQAQVAHSFAIPTAEASPLPPSNTFNKIVHSGDTAWIGTGKGMTFTTDAGKSWIRLTTAETFDGKGVSAVAVRGDRIWVATAFTKKHDNESIQTGHGLHFSSDRGKTWKFISQPVDTGKVDTLIYGRNKIPALAITVPEQNLTYDIALTSSAVWIASWGGMLRRSTDDGRSWQRVILPPDNLDRISPSDSLKFSLSNVTKFFASDPLYNKDTLRASLNHVMFSLYAGDDSTIWVGTANGLNKSTDGGISWTKFNHQNQLQPISGNFVVAITEQVWQSKRCIWAATNNAVDSDEKRGVSFSHDGGRTWSTALLGEFTHDIATRDSTVYVAADGGLYRSSDFGKSWIKSGTIFDPTTLQRFTSPVIYGVGVNGDTIWAAGPDGLAYTIDSPIQPFGSTWKVFRTYEQVGSSGTTYSYPLPFSPASESVRIHYATPTSSSQVTIRIFDFAMQPVRTLLRNATRRTSAEHDETWDGRDDFNRRVANGVYFYRVEMGDSSPQWGKILVLQ
jgi:photosystem II stability/assembly factor-like uncharacterized protein